jgi:hypothetical protein
MTDRPPLHQARLTPWKAADLKEHLAGIVDQIAEHDVCSVLDVVLELLGGELETFVLFGRLGHLDPPRPDGKIAWAVLRRNSADPAVNQKLVEAVRGWLSKS